MAAQALVAAVRTVDPEFHVHSLHSYFLLPGDYAVPIVYDVERIRDGRSFVTRRVMARQHGRPIYYQTAQLPAARGRASSTRTRCRRWAPPEDGLDLVDLMRERGNEEADALGKEWARARRPLPRQLPVRPRAATPQHPSQARMWIRIDGGARPTTRVEHLAAFTYASDISLLGASLAAHDARPGRAPRWPRSTTRSGSTGRSAPTSGGSTTSGRRRAYGGRGLSLGRVFTQDGTLVATVAQEGLIRQRADSYEGPGQA